MRSFAFFLILLACQSCKKNLDCECHALDQNGQVVNERNFSISRKDQRNGANSCDEVYADMAPGSSSKHCITK